MSRGLTPSFSGRSSERAKQISTVRAVSVVRSMRGGAQSVLMLCDDNQFYVVKFNDNPQGPNILANEMIGTEIFRSLGLPVPAWSAVYISEEFLRMNSKLMLHTAQGRRPPSPGLHFGSVLLGGCGLLTVRDILPENHFLRLTNREDFIGAYVLDVWANHQDHRQAVYANDSVAGTYRAVFIDHGHLFGGPNWDFRDRPGIAMALDTSVYPKEFDAAVVESWISRCETQIPHLLEDTIRSVPNEWYRFRGDVNELISILVARLTALRQLFNHESRFAELRTHEPVLAYAQLPLSDSRTLQIGPFEAGRGLSIALGSSLFEVPCATRRLCSARV